MLMKNVKWWKMEVYEIADRIDALRSDRGWSLYKLAEEAGLTQSTLINMRTRGTLPSITTLSGICNAFGITLSEFFADDRESTVLSLDEAELIAKYRKLTYKNKRAICTLIDSLE